MNENNYIIFCKQNHQDPEINKVHENHAKLQFANLTLILNLPFVKQLQVFCVNPVFTKLQNSWRKRRKNASRKMGVKKTVMDLKKFFVIMDPAGDVL
jgi:hypothetical protein